jgi:hypothetical protein
MRSWSFTRGASNRWGEDKEQRVKAMALPPGMISCIRTESNDEEEDSDTGVNPATDRSKLKFRLIRKPMCCQCERVTLPRARTPLLRKVPSPAKSQSAARHCGSAGGGLRNQGHLVQFDQSSTNNQPATQTLLPPLAPPVIQGLQTSYLERFPDHFQCVPGTSLHESTRKATWPSRLRLLPESPLEHVRP